MNEFTYRGVEISPQKKYFNGPLFFILRYF